MLEYSLREILEYSQNIEQESYRYYTEAAGKMEDPPLVVLLEELAQEELGHFNRIEKLLKSEKLTKSEMDSRISISREDHEMLIATKSLPEDPTAISILRTAHQRERNTQNVYRTLLALTDLTEDVVYTFEDLVLQEEGHARRLEHLMEQFS